MSQFKRKTIAMSPMDSCEKKDAVKLCQGQAATFRGGVEANSCATIGDDHELRKRPALRIATTDGKPEKYEMDMCVDRLRHIFETDSTRR